MKLVYPEISTVFDMGNGKLNTLVIENQPLMQRFLTEIQSGIDGNSGRIVLSENDSPVELTKHAEILSDFISFDINKKSLLTKITSAIEQNAVDAEHFERTAALMRDVEVYLSEMSFDLSCDAVFSNVNVSSLIKSAGVILRDEYDSIAEKIIDYMELVTEFERRKLFITVNMRGFVSDIQTELFSKTVLSHGYSVLMVENHEYSRLPDERRVVIDVDLCEIV